MSDDILQSVELQTSPSPGASVIWLHGLGADGYDFVPVVRELELLKAPPARYVFPHAPTRPVTINGGYVMRAWYDILGNDLVRHEDEPGIRDSQRQVEALIAREVERGTPHSRIVLAGFSQGGAIALQAGLRQQRTPGRPACAVDLPASGRDLRRRERRGESRRSDLHGARPQRPGDPARARGQFTGSA